MDRLLWMSWIALAFLGFAACTESDQDDDSEQMAGELSISLVKTIDNVGAVPNQVVVKDDYAYIVSSGDNVINRVDLETLAIEKAFIDLGQNAGPMKMLFVNDDIYVANYNSNQLVKISKNDPKTVETVDDTNVKGPMDLANYQNAIYVTNAEWGAAGPEGSIYRYDPADTTKNASYKRKQLRNPSSIVTDSNKLVVSWFGNYEYDASYNYTGTSDSGIAIWDSPELESASPTILFKDADVGNLTVAKNMFVAGSGYSGSINAFSKDLTKSASLKMDKTGNAMMTPYAMDDKWVAIASFNDEEIYFMDTNSQAVTKWLDGKGDSEVKAALLDSKYVLKHASDESRGPISMAWDAKRKHLLVLNNLSETLDVLGVTE